MYKNTIDVRKPYAFFYKMNKLHELKTFISYKEYMIDFTQIN